MKICYTAPWQHICIFTTLIGTIIAFSQRVSLNIAITEMVNHDRSNLECTWEAESSKRLNVGNKQLWSEHVEIIILAAFYVGYIISHIPGPIICDKYGSKYPLLICISTSSISTALIAIGGMYSNWGTVAIFRFLMGLSQGVLYPAAADLLYYWTSINENKILAVVMYSGNWIGMTVGYVLSGTFIVIMDRWDIQFFFWSLIGFIYVGFGLIYIHSKPEENPYIYTDELNLLQKPTLDINYVDVYRNICKDIAIWGLAVGQVGHTVVMCILVTYIPKYFFTIGFDLQTITLFSCNPYAGMFLFGYFASSAKKRSLKKYSIGCIRKFNTLVQSITTGGLLILATYWNCEDMFTLSITSAILCFEGFYYEGLKVNSLDLSIKYHRHINAWTNGIGNFGGVITSCIIAAFLRNNDMQEWRFIFITCASIQLFTSILFVCMGSGKRVKWDAEEIQPRPPGAAEVNKPLPN